VGNTEYEKRYYFLLDFCAVAELDFIHLPLDGR
jgi:hypothetical protein